MLIVALENQYRPSALLMRLRLARSSYFYHRARIILEDKYLPVRRALVDIFESNHRCYGYRQLAASLTRYSISISEKVVRRLMKQEALAVPKPRRRRYGSYLGEISPAPENIINRDSQALAPNEKWLTDITEFHIRAGYLSPIIDCFDGMVISWAIGTIRSMSRKASSQDNAAYEGFFGRLKTEFFYRRNWWAVTVAQVIDAVDAYIRWYNETRIKM